MLTLNFSTALYYLRGKFALVDWTSGLILVPWKKRVKNG